MSMGAPRMLRISDGDICADAVPVNMQAPIHAAKAASRDKREWNCSRLIFQSRHVRAFIAVRPRE